MSRKALLKRVPRGVEINGETVHVRSLTLREAWRFDELAKGEELAAMRFLVATCVVEPDGSQTFAQDDEAIADIPVDTIRQIGEAVKKVSEPGSVEKAEKN